mgnify:FL=1
MTGEAVAIAALGLSVTAQLVGIGVVYGIITTKLNGVRKDLGEHKGYSPSRAHAKE